MRLELEDLSGRSERSGRLGRSVLSERSAEGRLGRPESGRLGRLGRSALSGRSVRLELEDLSGRSDLAEPPSLGVNLRSPGVNLRSLLLNEPAGFADLSKSSLVGMFISSKT